MQLSEVIARSRQYFTAVTGHSGSILEQNVSPAIFEKRFNEADILTDNPAVTKWLQQMTYDQKGCVFFSVITTRSFLSNRLIRFPLVRNLFTFRLRLISIVSLIGNYLSWYHHLLRVTFIAINTKHFRVKLITDFHNYHSKSERNNNAIQYYKYVSNISLILLVFLVNQWIGWVISKYLRWSVDSIDWVLGWSICSRGAVWSMPTCCWAICSKYPTCRRAAWSRSYRPSPPRRKKWRATWCVDSIPFSR